MLESVAPPYIEDDMDIFATRRETLRQLVLSKFGGNRAAFSRAAGVHQNQINLILTENEQHRRNLGEALARKIEAQLALPTGRLDEVPEDINEGGVRVEALKLPDAVRNALRPSTFLRGAVVRSTWLSAFDSGISAVTNLGIAEVGTEDMAPDLHAGDCVLIDTGITAVSVDGVYLLTHAEDAFLRRVQKQLDGGFLVTANPARHQPLRVDNMKRIKVHGRVLLTFGAKRI